MRIDYSPGNGRPSGNLPSANKETTRQGARTEISRSVARFIDIGTNVNFDSNHHPV